MRLVRIGGPMGTSAPTEMQRIGRCCGRRAGVVAPYGCEADSAHMPFGLRAHNVRPYRGLALDGKSSTQQPRELPSRDTVGTMSTS